MTDEEKNRIVEAVKAGPLRTNSFELEDAVRWALKVEHDYLMLKEVLAGRLALRMRTDGTAEYQQRDQAGARS